MDQGGPGRAGSLTRLPLKRLRKLVLSLAALALVLYCAGVFLYLRSDEARRLAQLELTARDHAASAAENVSATLSLFDFALRSARSAVVSGRPALEFQGRLIMETLPQGLVYQLFYVGPDGRLGYSSLGPAPPNYLADRDYFQTLAATRPDEDPLVVSNPVLGRLTSKWSVQVARAVYREGRFAGLVALAVSPEKWTDTLRHFKLGERDTLALVNADGGLVLRTLALDQAFGKRVPADRPFLKGSDALGGYINRSLVDDIERYYAWQRLPQGLVVIAGLSPDDALAASRSSRNIMLLGAIAGMLGFIAAIFAVLYLIRRSEGAARRVEEAEARQSAVVSAIGDGLVIVSPRGEHLFHNEAYTSQFGGAGADPACSVVDAAGAPLEADRMPGVLAARSGARVDDVTIGVCQPEGEMRWLIGQARPLFLAGAEYPHGAVQITRDITGLRAALEAARIGKLAFEAAGEAILVTEPDGTIIEVNPAFSLMTGYPRAEAPGRNLAELCSEAGKTALAGMLGVVGVRGSWQGEVQNRRASGEEFVALYRVSALTEPAGQISQYVVLMTDVTDRKRHDERVWHQANFDSLTGLPNRVLLHDRLAQMMSRARRMDGKVGVLFIDLDRFKPVNDALGHAAGDELLRQVAHRLLNLFRDEDTCARLGGDEFVVLLPALREIADLEHMARKAVETLSLPYRLDQEFVEIGCSVGLATYPDDGEGVDSLLDFADAAMYRAKGRGRGVWSH